MKKFAAATALTLALSAPAFANSQLPCVTCNNPNQSSQVFGGQLNFQAGAQTFAAALPTFVAPDHFDPNKVVTSFKLNATDRNVIDMTLGVNDDLCPGVCGQATAQGFVSSFQHLDSMSTMEVMNPMPGDVFGFRSNNAAQGVGQINYRVDFTPPPPPGS